MNWASIRKLTPSVPDSDLRVQWERIFRSLNRYDLFEQLMLGHDVEIPFSLEKYIPDVESGTLTVSCDAVRFLRARWDPANLGKLDKEICDELGIDYNHILVESLKVAYKDMAADIKNTNLDDMRTRTILMVHRVLQNKLKSNDLAAVAELRYLVESAARDCFLPSNIKGALPDFEGNADETVYEAEFTETSSD
ncbi:hypothetical protein J7L85_01240, partial [candidate division WOR-3 bacterium]|nr:hypothetical protein [candidate division WOR-3 bacterium]